MTKEIEKFIIEMNVHAATSTQNGSNALPLSESTINNKKVAGPDPVNPDQQVGNAYLSIVKDFSLSPENILGIFLFVIKV